VNPVNVQAGAQERHFLTFDALATYTASWPVTIVLGLGIFTRLAASHGVFARFSALALFVRRPARTVLNHR
jgi:hypothetical protein